MNEEKCWCECLNKKCFYCEADEKFNSLSHYDKNLIRFFIKNQNNPAIRNQVNKFEERKGDWTDYVTSGEISA